jgi:hypothetical protein
MTDYIFPDIIEEAISTDVEPEPSDISTVKHDFELDDYLYENIYDDIKIEEVSNQEAEKIKTEILGRNINKVLEEIDFDDEDDIYEDERKLEEEYREKIEEEKIAKEINDLREQTTALQAVYYDTIEEKKRIQEEKKRIQEEKKRQAKNKKKRERQKLKKKQGNIINI